MEGSSLTLEYEGKASSRYDVVERTSGTAGLGNLTRPRLFETSHALPQLRLFRLEAPGERGWLKALRLDGYSPRSSRGSLALQQVLFEHLQAP